MMAGSFARLREEAFDRASRQEYARQYAGLTALERHKKLLHELQSYSQHSGGSGPGGAAAGQPAAHPLSGIRTDGDALREQHRFIRTAEDDAGGSREVQLARRYWDRLFKEYAVADLSLYKQSKVGLRWRTKGEVTCGKGQFSCGAKGCEETRGLASFEVNFAYQEDGQAKQALVKLRLCPACAHKLNWRKEQEAAAAAAAAAERKKRHKHKRKHRRSRDDSSSSGSEEEEGEGERRGADGHKSRRRRERERSPVGRHAAASAGRAGSALPVAGGAAAAGSGGGDDAEFDRLMAGLFEEADGQAGAAGAGSGGGGSSRRR